MKDVLKDKLWFDVSKQAVKALNESYTNYKKTANALEKDFQENAKRLNSRYLEVERKKYEASKQRITRDFKARNQQIRNELQADLSKSMKLQPLLRSEMDFLDSLRYYKPDAYELAELAQEKLESGADTFVRCLANVAAEQGYTLQNVPPSRGEILKRFDRLMGVADRIVNKVAPEDVVFAEADFSELAEDFQEFASERDRSGAYKTIKAIKTPTSLEEMIATDLQQEMEKSKNE